MQTSRDGPNTFALWEAMNWWGHGFQGYDLEVLMSLFVENLEDQMPREFQSRASIIRTGELEYSL